MCWVRQGGLLAHLGKRRLTHVPARLRLSVTPPTKLFDDKSKIAWWSLLAPDGVELPSFLEPPSQHESTVAGQPFVGGNPGKRKTDCCRQVKVDTTQ